MVQQYVDELVKIINLEVLADRSKGYLEIKHFFSGAAAYVNDKIFCTHTPKGLAIKLSKMDMDKLIMNKQGSELRYFPKAPIKKDYIVLDQEIVMNIEVLNYWIDKALNYVINY